MKIQLPDSGGALHSYALCGSPIEATRLSTDACRTVYAAAHVVVDPYHAADPMGSANIDWTATLAFRRHLHSLGLGIAEAMDTAQRGMGLDWQGALALIRHTRAELPDALVANGCGTDQLDARDAKSLDDVRRAWIEQLDAVQALDARVILMASRALARIAGSPDDYVSVYTEMLGRCDHPAILHWLGDMFDPALAGYWGSDDFESALDTVVAIIEAQPERVDGIKISLLDKEKEIALRRRLPAGVKMYSGDDFNYPELIAGDEQGFSHALLGVFDPLSEAAAHAVNQLGDGDTAAFRQTLDPTVPLARLMFSAPTQYYKTGVVFLAWLNGFQDHFIMLGGAQSARPLPYFCELFRLADTCGLLRDPELAVARMQSLLAIYGVRA
ncbi:MAG: dihydrodipicolinate synthase family protein [Pseudomonadota bacterium]